MAVSIFKCLFLLSAFTLAIAQLYASLSEFSINYLKSVDAENNIDLTHYRGTCQVIKNTLIFEADREELAKDPSLKLTKVLLSWDNEYNFKYDALDLPCYNRRNPDVDDVVLMPNGFEMLSEPMHLTPEIQARYDYFVNVIQKPLMTTAAVTTLASFAIEFLVCMYKKVNQANKIETRIITGNKGPAKKPDPCDYKPPPEEAPAPDKLVEMFQAIDDPNY